MTSSKNTVTKSVTVFYVVLLYPYFINTSNFTILKVYRLCKTTWEGLQMYLHWYYKLYLNINTSSVDFNLHSQNDI